MVPQPMSINQMLQAHRQISADYRAGRIDPVTYANALTGLKAVDADGRWWTCSPDGGFLWYDGTRWLPGQPPVPPAAPQYSSYPYQVAAPVQYPQGAAQPAGNVARQPAPMRGVGAPTTGVPAPTPGQPVQQAAYPAQAPNQARTAATGFSNLVKATPILAILPSILCGGLWFLYTFLGVFKSEGIGGVDCITPLIVGGLPVLFWALKKPLDKLLLPIKPLIQSFPKPLRLGVALAVPLLLGCGCSLLIPSGYLALNVSSFVSVMTAAVLLRF